MTDPGTAEMRPVADCSVKRIGLSAFLSLLKSSSTGLTKKWRTYVENIFDQFDGFSNRMCEEKQCR